MADLHAHTTASDGDYTPSQLVARARAAGLAAIAVTDHDTTAGVSAAVNAATGKLAVIPGVELSTGFGGRELHLLGLFIRPDDPRLVNHLESVCERRRKRFQAFLARLADRGVILTDGLADGEMQRSVSLGRRHLASLLVRTGVVGNRQSAFNRYIRPVTLEVPSSHLTPAGQAIRLIREAGGVPALAHPPEGDEEALLAGLRGVGLAAVEVDFPAASATRSRRLRNIAERLGLSVTGGSDFHSADNAVRAVGACGVTRSELEVLQRLAGSAG